MPRKTPPHEATSYTTAPHTTASPGRPARTTLLWTAAAVGAGVAVAGPLRRAASLAFLYATGTVVRDERPAAGGR